MMKRNPYVIIGIFLIIVLPICASAQEHEEEHAVSSSRDAIGDREVYRQEIIKEVAENVHKPEAEEGPIPVSEVLGILLSGGSRAVKIMTPEDVELPKPPPIPKLPKLPHKIATIPKRISVPQPKIPRTLPQNIKQPPKIHKPMPQVRPLPSQFPINRSKTSPPPPPVQSEKEK